MRRRADASMLLSDQMQAHAQPMQDVFFFRAALVASEMPFNSETKRISCALLDIEAANCRRL